MPPAFWQAAFVVAVDTSAANADPEKATANATINVETKIFMMFPSFYAGTSAPQQLLARANCSRAKCRRRM
jgi:hypothetical protein